MNTLLLIGLGPVQEFIERSRRMRDLWLGSHLLSEMARAVAHSLAERDGWSLVFPALQSGDYDLQPCRGMWKDKGERPLAIVNKVLAARRDTDDELVVQHARRARQAAIDIWKDFAQRAMQRAGSLLRNDLPPAHQPAQVIEDLLECIVAWSRYEDERAYGRALAEVEQRLASRKRLRDFPRWEGMNLPKSSLDGFRETVLVVRRGKEASRAARRFRLGDQEQLDGVGLIKRMGGEPEQFVPIARIAMAPWIDRLVKREQASDARGGPQDRLSSKWKHLVEECGSFDVPSCDPRSAPWMPRRFPYDGEIFLEGQWSRLTFGERSQRREDEERAFGKEYVAPVLECLSGAGAGPHPYVACLVADGDRMGETLSTLATPEKHVLFSRQLAEFARDARRIVESEEHFGVLIYSGGDDVLAFLPVHTAPRCAAALYKSFHDHLASCFEEGAWVPTLSIGIGVGHVLSPMGELLSLGREAEKLAKDGDGLQEKDSRDALAIIVDKRSGGQSRWRRRWPEKPLERLSMLEELFARREIPGKLPYEFRKLLHDRFPDAEHPEAGTSSFWADCLAKDLRAVLRRKRPDGAQVEALNLDDIDLKIDPAKKYGELVERVEEWIERALIAQAITESRRRVECIPSLEEWG